MIDFSTLNEEQKEAALAIDGPVCVIAGAGSGKTKTLTMRIAHMLDMGISPYSILAITFTNKAAKEMKERLTNLVGDSSKGVILSTFHSFCMRIIRKNLRFCPYLKEGFTVLDSDDQRAVVTTAMLDLNIDTKKYSPYSVVSFISDKKNHLLPYQKCVSKDMFEKMCIDVYKQYQESLNKYNRCDFDDLLFYAHDMMKQNEVLRNRIQDRFKYILIDEYQDTNPAQYAIVRQITEKYRNIFVVGDVDQAIYGFRGSDYKNILNFNKDFPDAKQVKLEKNYRSSEIIIDAANAVIENNKERIPKQLYPTREHGDNIKLYTAADETDEAKFVYDNIVALKYEYEYKDIAILIRNNNLSKSFEDIFVEKGIPYQVVGARSFYQRKEIKDVIAYLSIAQNPKDLLSLGRIINFPARGIGDKSFKGLEKYILDNSSDFFTAVHTLAKNDMLSSICGTKKGQNSLVIFYNTVVAFRKSLNEKGRFHAKIKKYLADMGLFEAFNPSMARKEDREITKTKLENIELFIKMACDYEQEAEEPSLENFLDYVSLKSGIDDKENTNKVSIITCHASKGLEFPVVFLVGMEESIFPSFMQ